MKFNEIWDPSQYKRGDEHDPRTPWYQGDEESELQDAVVTCKGVEIYDADGNELGKADEVIFIIDAKREMPTSSDIAAHKKAMRHSADNDEDAPKPGSWEVTELKIKSLKVEGKTYSAAEAAKKFGHFEKNDDIIDMVAAEVNK